jgi:predicted Zn finger-like uncharacterized protein
MRIACPSCAATYEVPASRLIPGKMVRCARCATDWLPPLENEQAVPEPEPAEAPADAAPPIEAPVEGMTAMDRLAASAAPPPARTGLIGAWVLTLVVLAVAVAATVGWRSAIVRAWPPSGRILATTSQLAAPSAEIVEKQAAPSAEIVGKQAAPSAEIAGKRAAPSEGKPAAPPAQTAGKAPE